MPTNSDLTDYETISRSPRSKFQRANVSGEGWINTSKQPLASTVVDPGLATVNSHKVKVKNRGIDTSKIGETKTPEKLAERWLLKRGHTLTYAGLFLFTAMVYFRPYELFPSLDWLSKSAFWIALATIAMYIPTQLALENRITVRTREVKYVLLLLLAAFLSIPLALEPLRAWTGFAEYMKVIFIFIVLVNAVRTRRRLNLIILLVLVSSCILSVMAVNDYRMGKLGMVGVRIQGAIGGLFDNPNDLALHLVTMIPIAIGMLLGSRGGKKLFFLATAILMVAGVVVTFSRGGFLGLCAAVGVLSWRVAHQNRWLVALCLPVFMVLFIFLAPGGYGTRMATTNDDSATARTDDLKRSIFIASHHPLLGVGFNNYILFSNTDHASHNAYTQVASELGTPAMICYIIFLIAPIKELRRIARQTFSNRRQSKFYYMAVGLEASLTGYMVSSFFGSVAFLWYAYYIVGYAVCLRCLFRTSAESDLAEKFVE